jgi:hypothetical protein
MNTRGIPLNLTVCVVGGNKFTLQMYSNDTVGLLRKKVAEQMNESPDILRLITSGKELLNDNDTLNDLKFVDNQIVHTTRHQKKNANGVVETLPRPQLASLSSPTSESGTDDPTLPSRILSQDKYFEQLFQLLNLQGTLGAQVWDLLMKLPTNQRSLDQLRLLQSSTEEPHKTNWSELLDARSLFKLLYSLQIVESLMLQENPTDKSQLNQWCLRFVQRGGVPYLFQILMNVDFFDETHGNKRMACLASLLKVIDFFVLTAPISSTEIPLLRADVLSNLTNVKLPELIHKLLDIIFHAASEKPPQHVHSYYNDFLLLLYQ